MKNGRQELLSGQVKHQKSFVRAVLWKQMIFFGLKGEVSWSETGIIGVDNQIELKKLCGFKKKSKSKDCVEPILEQFKVF